MRKFRDDNTPFTGRVAELNERIIALNNELTQVKSEIYVKSSRLVYLDI